VISSAILRLFEFAKMSARRARCAALFLQVDSFSFHLLQISPVTSIALSTSSCRIVTPAFREPQTAHEWNFGPPSRPSQSASASKSK
jgi:hypothetical protein